MLRYRWRPGTGSATAQHCTIAPGVRGEVWSARTPENTMVYGAQIVDVHAEYEKQYKRVGEYPSMLAAKRAVERQQEQGR